MNGDTSPSAGSAAIPPLPPGYTLDGAPAAIPPVTASAPPPLPPGYTLDQSQPPVPQTTQRGVAKNVGAGLAFDAPAGIINFASDLGANLLHPLVVGLGTGYDAIAPSLGLPRMTPGQRADLYGQPQPGQTQLPPEQQPIGTRAVNAADAAIPGQTAATLPATPIEAGARRFAGAAETVATLGPGGAIAPVVAGVSAAVAPEIAKHVPDWAQTGTELAVNAIPQIAAGAGASRGSPTVDAADAATVQLARDKFGIPLNATDITPGSQFRTPASVQASVDGLQGNIVKEMGEDPNTPDLASRNRITTGPGGVMDRTATRVGQVFDDVANRTDINPTETNTAVTKLANIDHTLDLENLTDAQKAMIRRNIDLVQDAAVRGNGSISGADYQGLTKNGTPIDRLASNSDPNVAAIGMQIKSAIDDGFQASASPADQAALTQARYQWRLMKTVQPLVERAQGANIDPGAFASRAVAASRKLDGSTGGIAYTGGGTIGELARIGDVISRGPTPVQPSIVGDILHPPAGGLGYLSPEHWGAEAALHGAQVVGKQIAGPYLRSGFNAQQVINNALYRPTLFGGAALGGVGGVAANQLIQPQP
jgi:hypothetical protein